MINFLIFQFKFNFRINNLSNSRHNIYDKESFNKTFYEDSLNEFKYLMNYSMKHFYFNNEKVFEKIFFKYEGSNDLQEYYQENYHIY